MAELTNLAAYLVSDAAGYINGEVVTIDGGEWIGGAGEFNRLSAITAEEWDEIATLTRGKKQKVMDTMRTDYQNVIVEHNESVVTLAVRIVPRC